MGVVHSMDDQQVVRVSVALKESAEAIQGINEKFDVVDRHWRSVQHFNEKINTKVEGALTSFQRLDSNFTERFDVVLETLAGATAELTDALENTLFALERFDMRREMNQLPKAVIPLAIPLILLLIELAVANAYLGILISSMVEKRHHGYSTYLLGNAGMVLLGLMLSLVWLGVYRVWLSHKSKKRQKRAREQAAIDEQEKMEKDEDKLGDAASGFPSEAVTDEAVQAVQYAKSSGSATTIEELKREEVRRERLERLQELRLRSFGSAESESNAAKKISSDVLQAELLRRNTSEADVGVDESDAPKRQSSGSASGSSNQPPKSPIIGDRVPLPPTRRQDEGGIYTSEERFRSEERSSSDINLRGSVERRVSPTSSEPAKRADSAARQQRLCDLREQRHNAAGATPSSASKTAAERRAFRTAKSRSGNLGAPSQESSPPGKSSPSQDGGAENDPMQMEGNVSPPSAQAAAPPKKKGRGPQLSWSSGLTMRAHWLFGGDGAEDQSNSPQAKGTSP